MGDFYQLFWDELVPILFKFSQKIEEERTHPYSFYKISNTLKPDNDITSNENYMVISAMNIDAIIFNKILTKNSRTH